MKVVMTSTERKSRTYFYRNSHDNEVSFVLPAYALNEEIYFPSEADFECFKKQAIIYIQAERLIINKTTGGKAEKINEEQEKQRNDALKKKAEEEKNKISENAKDISGVDLTIEEKEVSK